MKTVLITGISKGIGLADAKKFLEEGYRVIGTTRDGASPLVHENLKVYQLELSSPDSIHLCTGQIIKSGEKIDILINNAGALYDEDDTRLRIDKLRKTLEVNLIGTSDFTEKIIPIINRDGHIIFMSSSAGSLTDMDDVSNSRYPMHYPAYKISKCALNMYARTLALRLDKENTGIIVSSYHPGWVKTDMGGDDGILDPEEAAADIFKLAISKPETGQFWHKENKYPW